MGDPGFWSTEPITPYEIVFHSEGNASGRIEFRGRGWLYFIVTQRDDGLYQCWNCGDDVLPLAYAGKAEEFGEPGPTPWIALPSAIRNVSYWHAV